MNMSEFQIPVGQLEFDDQKLDVYVSLDEPIFKAADVSRIVNYGATNIKYVLDMCEEDEKLRIPLYIDGRNCVVAYITETGLYNILSQCQTPLARKWRRVIHRELIQLRRSRNHDIVEQFEEWDQMADNIYFDEDTGMLMESVTVAGGDVIQVPYEPKQMNN